MCVTKSNEKHYKAIENNVFYMEQTFNFTVKLSQQTYVLLREESKKREGENGAVPSRTARQLVEERLEEINADTPEPPTWIPTEAETRPEYAKEDQPEQKVKKSRSRKRDVGADESTPTT